MPLCYARQFCKLILKSYSLDISCFFGWCHFVLHCHVCCCLIHHLSGRDPSSCSLIYSFHWLVTVIRFIRGNPTPCLCIRTPGLTQTTNQCIYIYSYIFSIVVYLCYKNYSLLCCTCAPFISLSCPLGHAY